MDRQLSEWQRPPNVPAEAGWYEVFVASQCVNSSYNYVYWDGQHWHHCYGWPSDGNHMAWQLHNGKLVTPKHSNGEPIVPGHGAFEVVTPVQWRGFL